MVADVYPAARQRGRVPGFAARENILTTDLDEFFGVGFDQGQVAVLGQDDE